MEGHRATSVNVNMIHRVSDIFKEMSLDKVYEVLNRWKGMSYEDSLSKYELIFFRLHKMQNDFHWTSDTLNVLAPNLFFDMSVLPDSLTYITSLFTMMRALTNLDDVVESYLAVRTMDGFHIPNNKEYNSRIARQETMEHEHKVTYLLNTSSACEIDWKALINEFGPKEISMRTKMLGMKLPNINIMSGLDKLIETTKLKRHEMTAVDLLCREMKNLSDGVRIKIIEHLPPAHNTNICYIIKCELNICVLFVMIELLILPTLICNLIENLRLKKICGCTNFYAKCLLAAHC